MILLWSLLRQDEVLPRCGWFFGASRSAANDESLFLERVKRVRQLAIGSGCARSMQRRQVDDADKIVVTIAGDPRFTVWKHG